MHAYMYIYRSVYVSVTCIHTRLYRREIFCERGVTVLRFSSAEPRAKGSNAIS